MIETMFGTLLAVALVFVLAAVAARIARAIVHRLLRQLEIVGAENRDAVQARARQLTHALTMLAYGVAAMPSATGEHYYFAIMLPGSILGAVVGFATQRYPRQG